MLLFCLVLFLVNIHIKDYNNLVKKPSWSQYTKKIYMFLPRIIQNHLINILFY
jgi:hypothetical protein